MPEIALVTYLASPELSGSDTQLAAALSAQGCTVVAAPWDDDSVRWDTFSASVVRSTWDYHRRPAEFAGWLDRLDALSARLSNPTSVIRWNMHKRYLLDLHRLGVSVVPTEVVEAGTAIPLTEIALRNGWDEVVVKPAIGASATGVRLVRSDEFSSANSWFEQESIEGDLLVQKALPEIASGEWSLVFFGGDFSHAALKVPANGDIRVQARYGGTTRIEHPEPWVITEAANAVAAAASHNMLESKDLVYARVDGLCIDGHFVLMELELIEPGLFLNLPGVGGAADRFASSILGTLTEVHNSPPPSH